MADAPRSPPNDSLVSSPVDFAGGLFLIGVAAVGYVGAFALPFGHLSGIGSGLLPKVVAALIAAFGVGLMLQSFVVPGSRVEPWAVRGPALVLASVLVFAFTVRSMGLVVAGPLCFIIAAMADRETKAAEVIISAVAATLACGLLFKELLNLPIPFDPISLLGPLHEPYEALRAGVRGLIAGHR